MEQWVFGLVNTSHEPALGYMELVQSRDASTFLPIIQAHVHQNTTIFLDEWSAYRCVQQLPNVLNHETVKHSLHFVDPATTVHTQNVESYWNHVKGKYKRMKGVHLHQLPSYSGGESAMGGQQPWHSATSFET